MAAARDPPFPESNSLKHKLNPNSEKRSVTRMPPPEPGLGDLLAQILPTGVRLTIRHVSSTPRPCAALFAAPPGEPPEPTFCENHYLSVSAGGSSDGHNGREIIVFGIEVLIYTTAQLTTIFISKADSTGFLHRLKVPPKVSLLRLVCNAFLAFLVRTHQRHGVRLVLSLFARAQNQYLFPGSVHNPGKHVLDDRGLIRWWCRALDPILRQYEPESVSGENDRTTESAKSSATAFLIVPGSDRFEIRGFFPTSARSDDQARPRWLNRYPRQQLCRSPDAPPRCLVPRFPDDPKTRFLIDLDDELPDPAESGPHSGQWRSVKSLDQFWDMMSFRQECSSGRSVGFLWVVINPPGLVNSISAADTRPGGSHSGPTGPQEAPETSGIPKPGSPTAQGDSHPFHWPEAGRGHVVLSEADYKSAIDFLLAHEFHNEQVSIESTKAWADNVASLADQLTWGQDVVGTSAVGEGETMAQPAEPSNLMDNGLIRKRKKADDDKPGSQDSATAPQPDQPGVNMLNAGVVRKKKKT